MSQFKDITENGLWKQNPGVVQLLGLCPTLAVTTTVVNGVSLGLATALVMAAANGAVSPVRKFVPNEIRLPVFILVIAALVTVIDLSIHAFAAPLHKVLGIFIPLIVVNCIVLGRVDAFAAKNPPLPAIWDGLIMGIGLTLVLGILGGMREVLGKGTLFSGLDLALGEQFKYVVLTVIPDYQGFLLAALPPGAFLGLAFLIAAHNWAELRKTSNKATAKATDSQSLKPVH
ncbi:MAG: electron transport complex subunit E [Methylophilaceae bacterium]|nr:electron transport complex subunit E [Methylophilaceae bacterium]MDG1445006.1 electron transport complex subunit E [Methylophilaceae bacterium]MDG1821387.1 electron transport complex subunit E [Methylophilaceae bacterium]